MNVRMRGFFLFLILCTLITNGISSFVIGKLHQCASQLTFRYEANVHAGTLWWKRYLRVHGEWAEKESITCSFASHLAINRVLLRVKVGKELDINK